MPYVLDASVTLSWCFGDEGTVHTSALLDRLVSDKALVPAIWSLEVGNTLLSAHKRQRISYADIAEFLEMLRNIHIEVDADAANRAFHEVFSLAYSEGLTTYDAAYLELAMRLGLPLATKDKQLCAVASRLGIELLPV